MPHAKAPGTSPVEQNRKQRESSTASEGDMMASYEGNDNLSVPIRTRATHAEERIQMAGGFGEVHVHDVLCGRGKVSFNHPGNKRFREAITTSLDAYRKAISRSDKAGIVQRIIDEIASLGGRFLKKSQSTGEWYQLNEQQTKEKVSHAVRDAANTMDSRKQFKGKLKSGENDNKDQLQLSTRSLPSFSSRGSPLLGGANFYENLDRATQEIRRHASNQSNASWSGRATASDLVAENEGRRGSVSGERLLIRTVRDIQIPIEGQYRHPSRAVADDRAGTVRALLHTGTSVPGACVSGEHGRIVHTNSLSEPSIGGLQLPLHVASHGGITGAIIMPEGPRIGFGIAQHSQEPSNTSNSGAPVQPMMPPQQRSHQQHNADDGDNFLERINDVLGPLPADEDDPVASYLGRQDQPRG